MRRIFRWLLVLGLLVGLAPLTPLGVAAEDVEVDDCSKDAFRSALDYVQADPSGGTIRITCSGTITLSGPQQISTNVTIVGVGEVVLVGTGTLSIFRLESSTAQLHLEGLTLKNETGAAIYNNLGTVTVTDTTFEGNSASIGAAIYNGAGTVEVIASTFTANASNFRGGAIYNDLGTVEVTASTFVGNSSGSDGGAIYNNLGTVEVTDTTFEGNSASIGGAIYNNLGRVEVTASTFSGNRASNRGGAIYTSVASSLSVTSSTFSGNSAGKGGAIYADGNSPQLRSTILADSTGGNCIGGLDSGGYNLSDDASCDLDGIGDVSESTNIRLGPLQDNGGSTHTMLPLPGSAAFQAIPASQCSTFTTNQDQRGVTRPQGKGCEIGAVEVAGVLCANRSTGQLSGSLAAGRCPTTSTALVLPAPATFCVHPYTGALSWAPRGACGSGLKPHVVPEDGPLRYCEHAYTGALRYTHTGACSKVERAGVIESF